MKKALLSLLLICNLIPPTTAAEPKKPKLIVAIIVDQFRYDYLTRFRSEYNAGFEKLLTKGAVFTDAHHIATPTVTAIGHSTFLSGAIPATSGIVGNEWYDRETKQVVTSVSDDDTKTVGGVPGAIGSSPHRLLVSTIGDELKMHGYESKIIGISIKDRGAILASGHMADAAYWYDGDSNNWVSSTYYMKELPAWVKDVNKSRPVQKFFSSSWFPYNAKPGDKPFCTMVNGSDIPFCGGVEATPWGNELIEDLVERAVVAEKLGTHKDTDVLTVSFSSNDYVGHAVGPDDPEVKDISIRTDRLLGKMFDFIGKQVGDDVLYVLSADHGVAPLPETNIARKMPGGRVNDVLLNQLVQESLTTRYGAGKWILYSNSGSVYLNRALIASKKLDVAEVERTATTAALLVPHAYRVYSGEALSLGQISEDFITRAIRNGLYRQRSGDVVVVSEPYYIFAGTGASHGTPFNYDTHVPIIFMGPGIKPGSYSRRVAFNDIATTLANYLGIETPSGSVGLVLNEIVPQ